ncbi:hypothetical protein V8C37DRAFT_375652 [Trichoderma ceciliae]
MLTFQIRQVALEFPYFLSDYSYFSLLCFGFGFIHEAPSEPNLNHKQALTPRWQMENATSAASGLFFLFFRRLFFAKAATRGIADITGPSGGVKGLQEVALLAFGFLFPTSSR